MKAVLASQNKKKIAEMQEIMAAFGITLLTQAEAGVTVEVEETGETFRDNAFLKAEAIGKATGLLSISDDSGLCVDALGGAPGVYSARFGGAGLTDGERSLLLLEELRGLAPRTARFVCVICCRFPDGHCLYAEGSCEGTIAYEARGEGGFGYDPIFWPTGYQKSMAELTATEKHAISHRGKALSNLKTEWETYIHGIK